MLVKADVSWGKGNVCRKGDRSNVIALHTGTMGYMCFRVLKMGLSLVERVQVFLSLVTASDVFMMTITLYASSMSVLPVKDRHFSVLLFILRVFPLSLPSFRAGQPVKGSSRIFSFTDVVFPSSPRPFSSCNASTECFWGEKQKGKKCNALRDEQTLMADG